MQRQQFAHRILLLLLLLLLLVLFNILVSGSAVSAQAGPWSRWPLKGEPFGAASTATSAALEPTRVAFVADMDLRPDHAGHMLFAQLRREGAHATVHSGDLDYFQLHQEDRIRQRRDYPTRMMTAWDTEMGTAHPLFACFGNHDVWSDVAYTRMLAYPDEPCYAEVLHARMERLGQSNTCEGHLGGDSVCSFRGLLLFTSNVAIADERHLLRARRTQHERWLRNALQRYASRSRWRICHWHAVADELNTGNLPRGLDDDPGLRMYELCLAAGGIVITGHEHSYARTQTVRVRAADRSSTPTAVVTRGAPYWFARSSTRPELLVLGADAGVVIVNGMGGHDLRGARPERVAWEHWAKLIHAGVLPGSYRDSSPRDAAALLCDFGRAPDMAQTRELFLALYSELPASMQSRVTAWPEQVAICRLRNALAETLDEFVLLSLVESQMDMTPDLGTGTDPLQQSSLGLVPTTAVLGAPVGWRALWLLLPAAVIGFLCRRQLAQSQVKVKLDIP